MKKKILCLHGYSMDELWLEEWCRPFEALIEGAELVIPRAPIVVPEKEVRAMAQRFGMAVPEVRIGEDKNWCWYRATEEKPPTYQYIEQSLQMLENLFAEHGEFDGVLGWSQGTVMTGILSALNVKEQGKRFRFKWAVLCGGFRPGDLRFKSYYDEPINLPSLHVIGERESEFMRKQGALLADCFVDAETLHTPVGHIMPIKYPEYMEKIAQWMEGQS